MLLLEARKRSATKRKGKDVEEIEMDCWRLWSLLKGFLILWADREATAWPVGGAVGYQALTPETDSMVGVSDLQRKESEPT